MAHIIGKNDLFFMKILTQICLRKLNPCNILDAIGI